MRFLAAISLAALSASVVAPPALASDTAGPERCAAIASTDREVLASSVARLRQERSTMQRNRMASLEGRRNGIFRSGRQGDLLGSIAGIYGIPTEARRDSNRDTELAQLNSQIWTLSRSFVDPGTAEFTSSQWIAASEALPAFCEVTAKLHPAEGSEIGVVYRLPESWNGKLLGIGGGGWAGNITLGAASEGLSKGFATLQTDGGHPGTSVWDNSWAANSQSATDFAHRAVHLMTVHGKNLAQHYFGRTHDRAYFQGCSTGGRMALMEAQRYPDDYDGIIAGAPVYTLQVQTSAVFRNQTFAAGGGAGGFSADDLQLVRSAVLAECDGADGLTDGLINNPRSCSWQPAALQCDGAKTASCLAAPQVAALQTIYSGARASDGSWAMFPMSRGGEPGWSLFVGTNGAGNDPSGGGGLAGLRPIMFGDAPVDFAAFTDANYLTVRSSPFADIYEAATPDLSAFFLRGGRLIMWHGENDPGPSPVGSNDYAQSVLAENPEAAARFRYFTLPGVEHCRGGPGADVTDTLAAMDNWIDSGIPPDRLIGTRADNSLTRPHCAWPNVARYLGSGDANDPDRWTCVPRAS